MRPAVSGGHRFGISTVVRRVVDISGAAANAPAEAAPAPAIYAKPLLSPTDALAAALRGQDIPTSRQLTPSEVLHACTLPIAFVSQMLADQAVAYL